VSSSDENFLVVIATVIPVLFLALALQGDFVQSVVVLALRKPQGAAASDSRGKRFVRYILNKRKSLDTLVITLLICELGEEGQALASLASHSLVSHEKGQLLSAAYVLLALLGAATFLRFAHAFNRESAKSHKGKEQTSIVSCADEVGSLPAELSVESGKHQPPTESLINEV
jgi:hypothetical protein